MPDETAIPDWMTAQRTESPGRTMSGRRRRESAIAKTLNGLSRVFRDTVFSERIASRPGLLQRTDPRIKTLGLVGLLVVTAVLRQWYLLLALYGLSLMLAYASRISLAFFIKRVWLFIPLFAAIIALPSLFNVVRAGDPLWTIWDFGHEVTLGPWSLGTSLAITYQGVRGAAVLVLRVATSVSLAVLLTLTTSWADLLKALRTFYVPRVFVLILSMTYRYIFLLLSMAQEIFTARNSRMVGPSSPREDRRFMASSMGTMLGKSHSLSEEVYDAMVSRGYNGEPVTSHAFRARAADWVFLAALIFVAAAAIGGDRILG